MPDSVPAQAALSEAGVTAVVGIGLMVAVGIVAGAGLLYFWMEATNDVRSTPYIWFEVDDGDGSLAVIQVPILMKWSDLDMTGCIDGYVVTAGGATEIPWENRGDGPVGPGDRTSAQAAARWSCATFQATVASCTGRTSSPGR